ncbi:MAG: PilZ domain-containing protein [Bdellovibrionia bacterium]
MQLRKDERFTYRVNVIWSFFAQSKNPKKSGSLEDISRSGCLLKTQERIDSRRWLRIVIQDEATNLLFATIGRVMREHSSLHSRKPSWTSMPEPYFYGIEFTFPNYFTLAQDQEISALSKRNFIVRSCRSLNSKSCARPGFFA